MTIFVMAMFLTAASAQDLDRGKSIYVAKCQACHGPGIKGDGPAARALPEKVPDMTTAEYWDDMTDEKLVSQIQVGKPGSTMRAFPMKPEEMSALLAYMRTFASPLPPE
ncbi:MAG: cytochrome c [Proteobacteria bacterium]|nr:cytochrome c [Pseudomonadota bacterium]